MRVLKPAESTIMHLDRPTSPAVRRVEMERGRAGYGFTIAGQAPCVLRGIIKGSPAYSVGLRPGDRILRVNDTDVSEASHEVVVKLIGTSSRSLCLLVTSGERTPMASCSSDEELGCQNRSKLPWLNPGKNDPFLNSRDLSEPMLQSVGSFDTVFEISDQGTMTAHQEKQKKQRPLSEPDMSYWQQRKSKSHAGSLLQDDTSRVVSEDSVFSDLQSQNDFVSDSSILNVAMIVGYINSMELELLPSQSEEEALQAIRECISRIGIEQKTHSLVMMRVKCNSVQLCDDQDVVLASYPAENLALCVICTEDSRFFGLVSVDSIKHIDAGMQTSTLKTLCHVFFIDPELYEHKEHQSIIRHFGISCTPDPDTQGCLEFPQTPHSVSHFVSVLYTDMGDYIEKLRLKLDSENPEENARNNGSGSDSGIGNASPEDKDSLIGNWSFTSPNIPNPPPYYSQHRSSVLLKTECRCLLSEPLTGAAQPVNQSARADSSAFTPVPLSIQSNLPPKPRDSQRRPSIGLKARWQKSRPNSIECLVERDSDGPKSSILPPAMEQIPTLRYKPLEDFKHPQRLNFTPQLELTSKLFSSGAKHKDGENKGSLFWALTRGRSSVRRPSGPAKRLSLAHSLNDLESAASDGERCGVERHDCGSVSSLESNGSLPSVTNHFRFSERRVASWAVSFERLLQDPVGVRYFSEFLKKEFSEENILFWQACECFSQVPEHDKKQIFNLMKMDSYARFLKSTLYQECMLAEVEGRPLPDPCPIPCSPAPSKHSFTSDRSTFSTPKKENKRPKTGRSSDDLREKHSDKKNGFFSWYRYPSIGKGQKKRDAPDLSYNKSKTLNSKTPAAKKTLPRERDESSAGKPSKSDGEDKHPRTAATERKKGKKNHIDEAEEFFELLSRAQSSRVDDQRGLLRKEDLVLPDFLRVNPDPEPQPPACSTPTSRKPGHTTTTTTPQPPKPSSSNGHPRAPSPDSPPFTAPLSPILHSGPQGQEEEGLGDLTLVGEGDISSPNSTLLPPPPISPPPYEGSLPEANFTPPSCIHRHPSPGTEEGNTCTSAVNHHPSSTAQVLDKGVSVEGVTLEDSFEGYAAELRQCQSKMRNGIYPSTEASRPLSGVLEVNESDTVQYKATFV
ncbi:regulator of G- signaling 12-like protein [Labeo rohita]|uniref:Regulator of G-signaling 12-like protein n=1 Tax=Labeo rohita TaxID=84645 RepID=A0A498MJA4_LABRO|nr:regulator of G- signaling 12-like protein [Labeo rohita]